MSTLESNKQKLLCAGYIRMNTTYSIPIVIIKLFELYLNEILSISMEGIKLANFLNSPNKERFIERCFTFNHIKFLFCIYPNGRKREHMNSVKPYLNIESMPTNIESVAVYYEFDCKQTNSHWKRVSVIKASALKNDYRSWPKETMKLEDCINHKKIIFTVFVDLIFIQYNDNKTPNYYKQMAMKKHISFNWTINVSDLKYLIQRDVKCLFSSNIDNNAWSMYVFTRNSQLSGGIQLYRLPKNIEYIFVSVKMKTNYGGGKEYCLRRNKMYIHGEMGRFNCFMYPKIDINGVIQYFSDTKSALTLHCDIDVLSAIDTNGNEIKNNELSKWDIN